MSRQAHAHEHPREPEEGSEALAQSASRECQRSTLSSRASFPRRSARPHAPRRSTRACARARSYRMDRAQSTARAKGAGRKESRPDRRLVSRECVSRSSCSRRARARHGSTHRDATSRAHTPKSRATVSIPPWSAAISSEVERLLAERPQLASEKSSVTASDRSGPGNAGDLFRDIGPKGWEPLLYLCFTRLPLAATNDNAVAIARALLDAGADPNAWFMAGGSRYTPLVGVIGEGEEDRPPHPQRDALVRLLLDRGAEPYDIQVVYNTHFRGDVLWLLKLIHEYSVKAGRAADWDDPEWSMLDMGGTAQARDGFWTLR